MMCFNIIVIFVHVLHFSCTLNVIIYDRGGGKFTYAGMWLHKNKGQHFLLTFYFHLHENNLILNNKYRMYKKFKMINVCLQ